MNSSGGGIHIYGMHTQGSFCTGAPWEARIRSNADYLLDFLSFCGDAAGVLVRLPILLIIVGSRTWKMGDSGKPSE